MPNAVKIGRLTFRGGRGGGGWCGCLSGGDEPPEITYCVADGGGGALTLQSLTPTQPMPDQEELNAKFAELVVSTNVKQGTAVRPGRLPPGMFCQRAVAWTLQT